MKEIKIRFKTKEEFHKNPNELPFVITIDDEIQNNIKRFKIDLIDGERNLENYSYLIEKYTIYPFIES